MKFVAIEKMKVALDLEGVPRDVGTLAWSSKERQAYFEYAPEFIADPLPISPARLPARAGLEPPGKIPDEFQGLHGAFNDSLPDGWGRLLLDRRLLKLGVQPEHVTPLDRLSAVGATGMGALVFKPQVPHEKHGPNDLDWFIEQVERVQNEMDTADIDALQEAQGGSAGARPKIMVGLSREKNSFFIDYGLGMKPGFEHWIVKGRTIRDRLDIGIEEHAYALMARAAGLRMADTAIIKTAKGDHLFATKRFDRTPAGRLHMHTASGLLNASHRSATIDYRGLHKATAALTRNSDDVVRMFQHMVFNVFARNRDDHAKNHSYLMGLDGQWTLAPAYDLTFSLGDHGEHSAAINGEGRNPGKQDILAVARGASIAEKQALEIIEVVRNAVDHWPEFADEAGLGKARSEELDLALNGPRSPRSVNRTAATSAQTTPSPKPVSQKKRSDDDGSEPGGGSGPKR